MDFYYLCYAIMTTMQKELLTTHKIFLNNV